MDGSSWFSFKARPYPRTYPQSEARTWPVPGGARAGPRPRPRTPAVSRAVRGHSRARAHTVHEPRGCRARDTRMLAALAYGYDPDLGQAPARAL